MEPLEDEGKSATAYDEPAAAERAVATTLSSPSYDNKSMK